jgi:lysyl endopeptidase
MSRISRFASLVIALASSAVLAQRIDVVPGYSPQRPATATASVKAASALRLPMASASMTIALPELSAAEQASARTLPVGNVKSKPIQIGIGRDVPVAQAKVAPGALVWRPTDDGGRAAQIVVTSVGAAALRVAIRMTQTDPDVVVRVQGSAEGATPMGPVTGNAIAQATAKFGEWWSPLLEGSSATLEIAVGTGVDVGTIALELPRVSHLTQSGAALAPGTKQDSQIGASGSCNINWKCQTDKVEQLTNSANAVGRLLFNTPDGTAWLCTGTLLNDQIDSGTPYLFTANHCLNSAYTAATLNVLWFFDAVDCSHPTTPAAYQLQVDGAAMLGRSNEQDWSLVRLNDAPPNGTDMSGWDATPFNSGAVYDLHHPSGDLKKYSAGNLVGYVNEDLVDDDGNVIGSNYWAGVRWGQGVTEGGSSGSGLLTYDSSLSEFLLRGGLAGGSSSCSDPNGVDIFSRLDQMLPKMRNYLTPNNTVPNIAPVVEFYNASLNHYFMTADPGEINDLDTGLFQGWERTGLRFLAYTSQVSGSSPVCRAYLPPPYGDTHFYSALISECVLLGTAPSFIHWQLESFNVFYIVVPNQVTGACPSGTHPVWRFENLTTANHRYTDDQIVHDNLHADPANWAPEGYGPDSVNMCSPDGS